MLLDKDTIDSLFEGKTNQYDAIIALYKYVMPQWDNIAKIIDWPKCNEFTWKYIAGKFIELDSKYHPNVFAGGLWMNSGFSIEKTDDWKVYPADKVMYKGDKNPIVKVYINYTWVDSQDNCRVVSVGIVRKFSHKNYQVKHFAQFAKMLYKMGYTFGRLESNPRVCLFEKKG